jgi:phosphoribosylformylglycinamidine synthase
MAVGVVETDKDRHQQGHRATGAGGGNSTGRDGIGGASILASHEFGEGEEKRPTVQVGDPFTEKCLIEACLEALTSGGVVAIKDMGAAGLTCTTAEMSAAGGHGMDVDLKKVSLRESDMEPWEIMISESQERMLVVAQKGREDEVAGIFAKWGVTASTIGQVTGDGVLRIRFGDQIVAEMPAETLASPPVYFLPSEEPASYREMQAADLSGIPLPKDMGEVLRRLLASPNIASAEWVFRQYDHTVQTNTVVTPGERHGAPAQGLPAGIAITADGGRYCYPIRGKQLVLAEAMRNLVCVGGSRRA